jgi:hypothetical protein
MWGGGGLMSFKHLRMLNSASKCLKIKITLKVIKFSKPEKKIPKKHARILMLIGILSSLKQLLFLCSKDNFLQRTFITMGGCDHVLSITTLSNFN